MPKYDFKCTVCNNVELDIFIPAKMVNTSKKWNVRSCSVCNKPMEIAITRPEFIIKGWSPDNSRKAVKRFDEDYSIMEKGFESDSEMRESLDIAKEEEKRLGKEEGSLSGVRKQPSTPAEMEKAKKRASERVKEARKRRGA